MKGVSVVNKSPPWGSWVMKGVSTVNKSPQLEELLGFRKEPHLLKKSSAGRTPEL